MLGLHATCEVALREVSQFVGHDRGVLGFALGVQKQTAVDANDSAWRSEGVELRAIEQDEFKASVLQLAGFCQAIHAAFHVLLELRIGQLTHLATQQA